MLKLPGATCHRRADTDDSTPTWLWLGVAMSPVTPVACGHVFE